MEVKANDLNSSSLDGELFSIDDNSFIFEILRNKMYQDPISSICREVSCNARDANRAAGFSNKPIKIKAPTYNTPILEISDSGNGISPSLVSNVFIKYAASTKRDDNSQTGGFGLGAKTPFAYSDSFNVITVHGGTKYQYLCFIDETKKGKMSLIDKHETDEPSGTTISMKVNKEDISKFHSAFSYLFTFWSVKPDSNMAFPITNKIKETEEYFTVPLNSYSHPKVCVLIDEICYPVDNYKLNERFKCSFDLYLKFGNGELSVTPSRETLHYDTQTILKINEKIESFHKEMYNSFQNSINECKSFAEAVVLKLEFKRTMGYEKSFKFNGFNVPDNTSTYIGSHQAINFFLKNNIKQKLKTTVCFSDYIDFKLPIYINDLGVNLDFIVDNKRHFYKNMSSDFLITSKTKEELEKILPVDLIELNNLSTIAKVPKQRKSAKVVYYKFIDNKFVRVPNKQVDEDDSVKLICKIYEKTKNLQSDLIKYDHCSRVSAFLNEDISLYGVTSELIEDEDFINLDDYISMKMEESKEDILSYLRTQNETRKYNDILRYSKISTSSASLLKNKLKTKCNLVDEVISLSDPRLNQFSNLIKTLANIYLENKQENIVYEQNDIANKFREQTKDFIEKYSLLSLIDLRYLSDETANYVADYIDLINTRG